MDSESGSSRRALGERVQTRFKGHGGRPILHLRVRCYADQGCAEDWAAHQAPPVSIRGGFEGTWVENRASSQISSSSTKTTNDPASGNPITTRTPQIHAKYPN